MYEIKLFYCILQNKKKLIENLRVVTPPPPLPSPPLPSIAGTCTYLQCLSELFYRDRGKGGLTSNQNHRFLGLGDEFYTLLNYKNNISFDISNILEKKSETCKKKIIIYFFSDTLVHILYLRVHVSVNSLFTQYPSTRKGKFKFPKIHLLKLHVINKEQK